MSIANYLFYFVINVAQLLNKKSYFRELSILGLLVISFICIGR